MKCEICNEKFENLLRNCKLWIDPTISSTEIRFQKYEEVTHVNGNEIYTNQVNE